MSKNGVIYHWSNRNLPFYTIDLLMLAPTEFSHESSWIRGRQWLQLILRVIITHQPEMCGHLGLIPYPSLYSDIWAKVAIFNQIPMCWNLSSTHDQWLVVLGRGSSCRCSTDTGYSTTNPIGRQIHMTFLTSNCIYGQRCVCDVAWIGTISLFTHPSLIQSLKSFHPDPI